MWEGLADLVMETRVEGTQQANVVLWVRPRSRVTKIVRSGEGKEKEREKEGGRKTMCSKFSGHYN